MADTKPTNPKDQVAISKLPFHLVPNSLMMYAAVGFAEGAYKYGSYNWRPGGARASVYVSALHRHLAKWWNGEDTDRSTRVHHLASAVSCLGIIIDALEHGCLIDDRPPVQIGFSKRVDEMSEQIKHLQNLFKEVKPHHHTAKDFVELHDPAIAPTAPTSHRFHIRVNDVDRWFDATTMNKGFMLLFRGKLTRPLELLVTDEQWKVFLENAVFPDHIMGMIKRYYNG